jgi:hypothetical protein
MKPLNLNPNKRHRCDQRPARQGRNFPQIEQSYQATSLGGTCGTPAKFPRPSFFEISQEYFADEAPRSFAVEAAIFTAFALTALLPIVNSVQAIAALVHTANLF